MTTRLALWLSGLANLALLGWIGTLWLAPAPRQEMAAPGRATDVTAANTLSMGSEERLQPPTPATGAAPEEPFHWRRVESPDYAVYIANLRSIGCPERTIRQVIRAELDQLYTRKRQELVRPFQAQLWEYAAQIVTDPEAGEKLFEGVFDQMRKQVRQFHTERDNILRELLGAPPAESPPAPAPVLSAPAHLAGYLTESTWREVLEQERSFNERQQEARVKHRGDPKALAEAFKAGQQQKQEAIRALLTPEQYEEYRLRTGPAASLRYTVYGFEPREDEWRQLVSAKATIDERQSAQGTPSTEAAQRENRERAKRELDEQFQAILGPERFREFQRAQDPEFHRICRVTSRCDLPATVAAQVYEARAALLDRARQVQKQPDFTDEERAARLQQLQREGEQTLGNLLPPPAFEAYRRYDGKWLRQLAR